MKVVFFSSYFALHFFLKKEKNSASIAVIGSSLSRVILLFREGERRGEKTTDIMLRLRTSVRHCFRSFRVLGDKKKKKNTNFFYVIKHATTVINV